MPLQSGICAMQKVLLRIYTAEASDSRSSVKYRIRQVPPHENLQNLIWQRMEKESLC